MPKPPYKKFSIVLPIYIPNEEIRDMSDINFLLAKSKAPKDVEWVIVETGSRYYLNDADIYIYEKERTHPDISTDRGFRVATGEYVVFLSNDITVCDGWIEKMYRCFEENEDCGVASLGNNEHNDFIQDKITSDCSPYFSVCMIKKEDAWFDLSYPFNFADTDLLFRVHKDGKKWYKNLNGLIYHKNQATCGKYGGSQDGYRESRAYFLNKYIDYKDDVVYKILGGV